LQLFDLPRILRQQWIEPDSIDGQIPSGKSGLTTTSQFGESGPQISFVIFQIAVSGEFD
jgi:hypothetical protein